MQTRLSSSYEVVYFPNLAASGYRVTSPQDKIYNCVGWALGDATRWWQPGEPEPGFYWPDDIDNTYEMGSYIKLFESKGYAICENYLYEADVEKIALYEDDEGDFTHVARQLPGDGGWTSKLGELEDICHVSVLGPEGRSYGKVSVIMKRLIHEPSKNSIAQSVT